MRDCKAFWVLLTCAALLLAAPLAADDDSDMLDSDNVDSLFEDESTKTEEESGDSSTGSEETGESEEKETQENEKESSGTADLLSQVEKKPGYTIKVGYNLKAGYSLTWNYRPWEREYVSAPAIYNVAGADLNSTFSLDYQLSPELEVKQAFAIGFPGYNLDVKKFFADYRIGTQYYFRLGQQNIKWGLSPNYPFTNIAKRTPPDSGGGDTYAIKFTMPIGIGGFETLALTRRGFIDDIDSPKLSEVGVGAKYNLAVPAADLNIGAFYYKEMKFRSFYSLKTTLFDRLEVYQEGMLGVPRSVDYTALSAEEMFAVLDLSANIGFYDDFFGDRLKVNGEYFYNGEGTGGDFELEEELEERLGEEPSPFIYGHNLAFTLTYDPNWSGLRLFTRYKHNFNEQSGYLNTGLRFSPLPDMKVSIAAPLVVGLPSGSYYTSSKDSLFRIAIGVTIGESYTHKGSK